MTEREYYLASVNATPDLEHEARKQVERDLKTQLSREPAYCSKCSKQVNVTIDGRCLGCYSARTFELFGVKMFIQL